MQTSSKGKQFKTLSLVAGAMFCATFLIHLSAFAQANDPKNAPAKPESIYRRCYKQLTKTRVPADDPRLAAINAGNLKASDACLEILELAVLNASGNLKNNTPTARAVLRTLHDLHRGWYGNDQINRATSSGWAAADIYDLYEPALFTSRALLLESGKASDIVTSNQALESIRSNPSPQTGAIFKVPVSQYYYPAEPSFAITPWNVTLNPTGELTGIRGARSLTLPFSASVSPFPISVEARRNLPLLVNRGGGILGSNIYYILNNGRGAEEISNGGLVLPRRWSMSVMRDLLCKDLPTLRYADVTSYPTSTISFRQGKSCMQCHTTMDPLAGVVRNRAFVYTGFRPPPGDQAYGQTFHILPLAATLPAESTTQPPDDDPNFAIRPTNGRFTFRGYDGSLIDTPITSTADLGTKISQTPDFYACIASRYAQFFTGTRVTLQDPSLYKEPKEEFRKWVIQLGEKLRNDPQQNLRQMIKNIFESPYYSKMYLGGNE